MLREIITVGDPRLRQRSLPVEKVTPEIRQLIDDMIDTMYESNGAGLAAVQVGVLQRIIVIDVPEPDEGEEEIPGSGELYVVLNPEIIKLSPETEIGTEGCLSVPGYAGKVERSWEIVVRGLDVRGRPFRLRPKGWVARVFQHEIDHCQGILYIDRLVSPDSIWQIQRGTEEKVEREAATVAARAV